MSSAVMIENGYKDWIDLLEHTNNKDLLNDPYNVWLEAFTTGTLLERVGVVHVINTIIAHAKTPEERSILQAVIAAVESKGIAR